MAEMIREQAVLREGRATASLLGVLRQSGEKSETPDVTTRGEVSARRITSDHVRRAHESVSGARLDHTRRIRNSAALRRRWDGLSGER